MTGEKRSSRRQFLRSGAAATFALGVAGCTGGDDGGVPTEGEETTTRGGTTTTRDTTTTAGGDAATESDTTAESDTTTAESETTTADDSGGDLRAISYGDTKEGVIDEGDARDPEYGGLAEPVEFEGEAGDVVTATMVSADLDAVVVLTGPEGSVVAENDDGGGDTDSRLRTTLPSSGTHTIWAGSFEGDATGAYTLSLAKTGEQATTQSDGGDLRSISYGETKEGVVDGNDARDPVYSGLSEPVEFEAEAGDRIAVTMESSAFDTYLVLSGPDGSAIAENDDGAGATNSRLETTLTSAGAYTIWAGSYSESATGSYVLSLAKTGETESGGDLRAISYGQTREGFVDQNDARDPQYSGLAEPVEFDVQSGDRIAVTMESSAFDTYLVLAGPNGNVIAENDDGAGATNSRLETTLTESGTYTVWAGSYSESATGSYVLSLAKTGETESGGDLRSISFGQTKDGLIDQNDARDPVYSGLSEPVEFDAQGGEQAVITMESSEFDTYLVLTGPGGNVVTENDDGAGATNSRIRANLSQSGTYTIWAGSYSESATGAYTLSLRDGN